VELASARLNRDDWADGDAVAEKLTDQLRRDGLGLEEKLTFGNQNGGNRKNDNETKTPK
jgi:hypothetical protein